jgi:penicillin V acylase-like amidase (Ntn superfamily)
MRCCLVMLLVGCVLALAPAQLLLACSAALLRIAERPVMVRNYDWHIGNALLMMNQPGIAKRALAFDNPAEWTSKYGSITINQYGRELPVDGINEQGLAIAVLWLDETEYPETDERPSVSPAQWVQYQLDTAKTVEEVLASDNIIRINPYGNAKVHYFVSDANGDCAVIDFLDGRMVAHRGDNLQFHQITNNTCSESQGCMVGFEGFGGGEAIPADTQSLSRYARLASVAAKLDVGNKPPHQVGFDTIHQVRQRSTQWQLVYDLEAKKMFFRTPNHSKIREIELAKCEFDAASPTKILDIQAPLEGDVIAHFREYSRDANKELVEKSVAGTKFAQGFPPAVVQMVINYPDHACVPAEVDAGATPKSE